ncbi:Bax inhibitor-1/YccA family protein [uncultured Actinomyces sp.]|uniref:Bax inhibitor-1/YccA family protein n=1 Tax=uncultured Actinomyces sp. TaxID=249061 RepID=UPI0028EED9A9|nr:Bax inhibitor-1/YccA family protein [uncultured Actinomyces sp.]
MANPVMNSIVKDWSAQSQTPAGYPTMPGYQPAAQQAPNPYGGQSNPYATQQGQAYGQQGAYGMPQEQAYGQQGAYGDQMASYEAMMNAPAADAVDRGRMTYDDVVVKSLMCFGLLVAGAVVGWMVGVIVPGLALLAALGLCAVTLGLGLFVRFSKKIRPAAIIAYSLIEGFVLGALSFAFETLYPGIVVLAVLATLIVIGVTLAAFSFGFVRNSKTLTRVALLGSTAFAIYYGISFVLGVTGIVDMTLVTNIQVFGIPLGVIIGVLAVIIGVLCLVRDFDAVKVGVANNVPEKYSWLCAFAIMTDVIWIYLEILRILSYFMRRN